MQPRHYEPTSWGFHKWSFYQFEFLALSCLHLFWNRIYLFLFIPHNKSLWDATVSYNPAHSPSGPLNDNVETMLLYLDIFIH